jgi:ribosomal subunit interface protein
MQVPVTITFHGLDPSDAVEQRVRERASKLERHFDRVTSCRVTIEAAHRQNRKGQIFRCAVDVTVPGAELVANRTPGQAQQHEDVYVAVRDAFDAMDRQLQSFAEKRRGETKNHVNRGGP